MSFYIEELENERVINIIGSFDSFVSADLRKILEDFIASDNRDLVLNLQKTTFLDSSGIGAIVFAFKRLSAQGRKLVIHNINGQPAELTELLRIGKTIPIFTPMKQATIDNILVEQQVVEQQIA